MAILISKTSSHFSSTAESRSKSCRSRISVLHAYYVAARFVSMSSYQTCSELECLAYVHWLDTHAYLKYFTSSPMNFLFMIRIVSKIWCHAAFSWSSSCSALEFVFVCWFQLRFILRTLKWVFFHMERLVYNIKFITVPAEAPAVPATQAQEPFTDTAIISPNISDEYDPMRLVLVSSEWNSIFRWINQCDDFKILARLNGYVVLID